MAAHVPQPLAKNGLVPRAPLAEFLREFVHDARNATFPLQVQLHLLGNSDSRPDLQELSDTLATFLVHHRQLLSVLERAAEVLRGAEIAEPTPIDLCSVLQMAVRAVQPRAEQKGQQLYVEVPEQPLWVLGDPELLGRAFGELLDNAVRHTPEGGWIELRAGERGGRAIVVLHDSGPGIDERTGAGVFEPFQCGGAMRPIEGRAGLGLSLTRQIIDAHCGCVSIVEAPVRGAEFRVELGVRSAPQAGTSGQANPG